MAHALYHSISSQKQHGGKIEDYYPIHEWFDESKKMFPDNRHRALRHHSEGIFACEEVFGKFITNSDGKMIPVRAIGEQHVKEDLGRIPTLQDWLQEMTLKRWMCEPGEGRKAEETIRKNKEDYVKQNK